MEVEPGQTTSVDQRRAALPGLAYIAEWARAKFGADFVNQQMATAQQARREYDQVLATQGPAAARRWHVANAHRCTFYGSENGRTFGMQHPFGNDIESNP